MLLDGDENACMFTYCLYGSFYLDMLTMIAFATIDAYITAMLTALCYDRKWTVDQLTDFVADMNY
jgi:hypothetical protein